MRKFLYIILFTTVTFAEPFYMQKDKQKHMQVSAMVGFISSGIARDAGYTHIQSVLVGIGSALLIGLAKEGLDSRKGGSGFSAKDMLADGVGGAIGTIPILIIKW